MWTKALWAPRTAALSLCASALFIGCTGNPAESTSLIDSPRVAGETLWSTEPDGAASGELTAEIEASSEAGLSPLTVRFTGSCGDVQRGRVVTYTWDFGDGLSASGASVYHTFSSPGAFAVRLSATDDLGAAGNAEQLIAVLPVIGIRSLPESGAGSAPLSMSFFADDDALPADFPLDFTYRWTFGDGTAGAGQNVVHTFQNPGSYVVVLSVELAAFAVDCASTEIVVDSPAEPVEPATAEGAQPLGNDAPDAANLPPVANAGQDLAVTDGDGDGSELVALSGAQSHDPDGTIVEYRWTEGAMVLYDGPNAITSVALAVGSHALTLVVRDNGGLTDSDEVLATVLAGGALSVTPVEGLNSAGSAGGPFSPDSKTYTLANPGISPIHWTATKMQPWITLSGNEGTIEPGAAVTVTVQINDDADSLAPGSYSDEVAFTNATNGAGSTARAVQLLIDAPPGVLAVSPADDLSSVGHQGGPFDPNSKTYSLTNSGGQPINWLAERSKTWVTLSAMSGTLAPGDEATVSVSINANANSLAQGSYDDEVQFSNQTNHAGDATRSVLLTVLGPSEFVISGRVTEGGAGISGVTLGGLPGSPMTNASGDYSATVNYGWSGTATPSKSGYTFTPTSRTYTNVTANQTNQNYTATLLTFTISGHVADGGGTAISGVTLSGLPGNPSTNASGDYGATVNYGWSGTATPSKSGYTFAPASRTYANVAANQTNQTYTGTVSGCDTSTTSWQNIGFASQSGTFTAEFDAIPNNANMDGITALSTSAGANYADFAILVRFNDAGTIDARNGGVYSAGATIPYTPGTNYHFRLVVIVPSHTYSIYVTPGGASEQTLGTNYAFRTEQAGATSLANWALIAGSGSHQICDFAVESGGGPGTLVVAPSDGFSSSGAPGGPFAPSSKSYTLTNAGGQTISWTATKTQTWVSLSAAGGDLAAGASATLAVSLNGGANSLPEGNYSDVVTFTNTTNGGGNTTRAVSLSVYTGQQVAGSITQNGITWTFSQSRPVGQFANGDWWVVAPVTVTAITRPHGTNGKDGSMVNPRPSVEGTTHGYDDQVGDYQASLDVSRALPYTLSTDASLVSVISWVAGDPGCPGLVGGKPRPNLRSCAVLTCLTSPPPSGTMRPAYCGVTKPLYHTAQIRRDLLLRLAQVPSTPSISTVEEYFARVWLDHVPNWPAQDYMHPSDNMPWYGRELAGEIGDGALLLLLDRDDKETLLVRYVQLGIDLYGIASNGGYWAPNGGIAVGRKWPIIFAGLMLDNSSMRNIGTTVMFQEDGQTFVVEETSPGVYNWGYGGYDAGDVGLPEWGIRHATVPSMDNKSWSADYRCCCTNTAMVGQVLAARALGLRSAWDHEPLFDYQDRYMQTEQGDFRAWSNFAEQMWDLHRPAH